MGKLYRYSGLTVALEYEEGQLSKLLSKKLGIRPEDIQKPVVFKRSVDARKFPVTFSLTVDFEVPERLAAGLAKKGVQLAPDYTFKPVTGVRFAKRPVVVGFGPAGIFAAYYLAQAGHRPIVIERGEAVAARTETVKRFWESGVLDPESNVQFGEGGAGAFSDGKLTTRVKDPLAREVFRLLVAHGAPERILMDQKPHVGTDLLVEVVSSMRRQIEEWGGECHFKERFESLEIQDGRVCGLVTSQGHYETDCVLLAIGHSARDTYRRLHAQGVAMSAKPFAMGLRIEHPQSMIDTRQYGPQAGHPRLGAADYAVKAQAKGRGVYSFCMCPGGHVINASSSPEHLVVNGMSYHARDAVNANSALLVTLNPEDFPSTSSEHSVLSEPAVSSEHQVLAGMAWQEALERAAYQSGIGATSALTGAPAVVYSAPVQCVGDFIAMRPSAMLGAVKPSVTPDCHFVDFNQLLPPVMAEALREALPVLGRQIQGFDREDALLTGVETRSSSPVRLLRGENRESENIKGLFPVGEGAGYAGGITSAAIDGLAAVHGILQALNELCHISPCK